MTPSVFMKKLIIAHQNFVVLFAIFFGGDVIYSLYQFFVDGVPVYRVAVGLGAGFIATAVVLYIALKMMGLWKVEDDSVR